MHAAVIPAAPTPPATVSGHTPLERTALDHLWVHRAQKATLEAGPLRLRVMTKGEGVWLTDDRGKRYLDAISGLWTVAAGHGRREIAEAMADQAARLSHVNTYQLTSDTTARLAERVTRLAPGGGLLDVAFLSPGGGEAVEAAIKIARQYQQLRGFPKRFKLISRRGSFHGDTYGAASLTGSRFSFFEPYLPGIHQVPNVMPYRCPNRPSHAVGLPCDICSADVIEQTITYEGPETVAAVIMEPISVSAGTHIPPPDYLRRVREICDRHGVLLILDEVINGFGRTGRWFASEHFGVVPDIMTVAKGITSGYAPLGATLVRREIADAFVGDSARALAHGSTFGGHPVSCAAALANLDIFEREGLVERAAATGRYLLAGLERLRATHPIVGDARGLGLLCVLDLVKAPATLAEFTRDETAELSGLLADNGVITRVWSVIQIAPPLVTSEAEIDFLLDALDRSIGQFERRRGYA